MTERWRLLRHFGTEPGRNMAVDEALLVSAGPTSAGAQPALRFYTWEPAALSLGYFQRWKDVPAAERTEHVVRRLTGGGAIHHADELTFSIALDANHPLYRGEVAESYDRVHRVIAAALAELGAPATLRGESAAVSDAAGTGMCFHESTPLDLVWGERKGLGSAQRRTGGRVLHHGSIKIGRTDLEPGVAILRDHAPDLTPEELAERLEAALAEAFDLRLEPGELTAEEEEHARARAGWFRSAEFLHRR